MLITLDRRCLQVPLEIPLAVELSIWSGVAGCRWPISSRVVLSTVPSLAFKKRAPSSASVAEDMTCFRILAMLRIGPLGGGGLADGGSLR